MIEPNLQVIFQPSIRHYLREGLKFTEVVNMYKKYSTVVRYWSAFFLMAVVLIESNKKVC